MGVIKDIDNGWVRIEEVLMERLPNSVKVSWDTPYYHIHNPLHHLAVSIVGDIINIQRWDNENPLYNDNKEWINDEHLPTL